jgi:hypothetical protein
VVGVSWENHNLATKAASQEGVLVFVSRALDGGTSNPMIRVPHDVAFFKANFWRGNMKRLFFAAAICAILADAIKVSWRSGSKHDTTLGLLERPIIRAFFVTRTSYIPLHVMDSTYNGVHKFFLLALDHFAPTNTLLGVVMVWHQPSVSSSLPLFDQH